VSGFLALEDGTVFRGESVGAEGFAVGEAVFTTAMTGYQEIVTDPSFAEQLVCFTAPMVGNYGVAEGRSESSRSHARAVLMREARGPAWTDWLHERGIVALTGIDTRSLVLRLREAGALRAVARGGRVDATSIRVLGRGPGADRRRGLRLQALDPAQARRGGCRRDGVSARRNL
jgi:carbamoyl-phosphate synthase small subunit